MTISQLVAYSTITWGILLWIYEGLDRWFCDRKLDRERERDEVHEC